MMKSCGYSGITIALFLNVVLLASTAVTAQERPQRNQAGERMGPARISNSWQGGPIEATALISIGNQSYSAGTLTITNVSDKPVVAIKGAWQISTSEGGTVRHAWDFGGPLSLFSADKGMIKRRSFNLPFNAPPNLVVDSSHRITNASIVILGVVFSDRTWWGDEGYDVYRNLLTEIQTVLSGVRKIREECANSTSDTMSRKISDLESVAYFPRKLYRIPMKNYLIDLQGNLRADAIQRLDKMIASLSSFLSQ
ncbi:MAG: hypothetical protein MN733_18755 [Nitrososphaera sp.]|nr:hypothetical protein [Nitrososphaera sp.]